MKPHAMQLLKFYTDWCNPCKSLTQMTEKITLPMQLVPVNLDENLDFALKYKVRNVPTLILINHDGEPLEIANGLQSARDMLKRLSS